MSFVACTNCGCNLECHVSDFLLNGNWKDGCQNTKDGNPCTCDEFKPTLKQLVSLITM